MSEGLQDAETPEQWPIQRALMAGDVSKDVAIYPALERVDADRSFADVRKAPPMKPMPLAVLSADRLLAPQFPALIKSGAVPAGVPPDFGAVLDAAQKQAQAKLAQLAPGARHVVDTNSGHEIHKEQPQLVIDAISAVVDAVRSGKTQLDP